MKIGNLDINKAYLGTKELSSSNAFVGSVNVIGDSNWELVTNEYIVDVVDGQYYQKYVKYGSLIPGVEYETPADADTTYNWIDDTISENKINGYTYLMSNNKGIGGTWACVKLKWTDLDSFNLYYRSYAETGYDYVVVSSVDAPVWTSLPSKSSSNVIADTCNTQGLTFNVITVESSPGSHWMYIAYRKDAGGDSNQDRGFIGFLASYREILGVKEGSLLPSTYEWTGKYVTINDFMFKKLVRIYTLPDGSTVINEDDYELGEYVEPVIEYNGLTFESLSDCSIALNNFGGNTPNIQYAISGKTPWIDWDYSAISLSSGDKLYLKGTNIGLSTTYSKYSRFVFSGNVNASGDIMGILDGGNCTLRTISQNYCFFSLFSDNKNLISAPELTATNLDEKCYWRMFSGCSNLLNAPALPATNLDEYCYWKMFNGCTKLVSAPELPATELKKGCYEEMFRSCTTLVNVPELPAIVLAEECYDSMFYECTKLVNAPVLHATSLAPKCYLSMFCGCTSLTTAPELNCTSLANNCYHAMFYKCTSLVNAPELPATNLADECYYNMFNGCISLVDAPALPATNLASGCYKSMFSGCINIVNAPELPATNLASSCYNSMFYGCTALENAPELPATTVNYASYVGMFRFCTSLVNAPALPATNLSNDCYEYMFQNCTSLVDAPALPATTLKEGCYYGMFSWCTSLVNAPVLPATTTISNCYYWMFYNCNNLNKIITYISKNDWNSSTENWLFGVSSTGDFYNLGGVTFKSGESGIPEGWTEHTSLDS